MTEDDVKRIVNTAIAAHELKGGYIFRYRWIAFDWRHMACDLDL